MSKPAEGEWVAVQSRDGRHHAVSVVDYPDEPIATLRPDWGRGPGEQAANARLMAASKDLLEACEAIHGKLDYIQSLWGKEGVTDGQVRILKAAIAKAKGEPIP